jgi:hypothetical protein
MVVHLGHHAIDDHDVELAPAGGGEALLAIGPTGDVMTGFGQAARHGFGRFQVVFDDQDPHVIPHPVRTGKLA